MDTTKFVEAVGKSGLPFVYSGDRLNDENCQKTIKKIGAEGTVKGAIFCNAFAMMGLEGLAITEQGIYFSLFSGVMPGFVDIPKIKGTWLFDKFLLHNVTVKKDAFLTVFEVEFTLWDITKNKSSTFKFNLPENPELEDSMTQELQDIFNTLTSKNDTEYVSGEDATEKDPNKFDFEYGDFHTVITLEGDSVVIKNFKVDDKTKIQTPKGTPVTIPRSAIASIKAEKSFSPSTFLKLTGVGIVFLIVGGLIFLPIGIIAFLLFIAIAFSIAFPKTLIIVRKDGTKFTTRMYAHGPEYERFVNTIFK